MPAKDFNHHYRGYALKIYDCEYAIYYPVTETKWKCIRTKDGGGKTFNTHYGKMHTAYKSDEMALQKAKEYIDNFLVDTNHKYSLNKTTPNE